MRPAKRVLITSSAGATEVVRDALHLQLRLWRYRVLDGVLPGDPEPDAVVTVYASMEHITLQVNQRWPAPVVALVRNELERRTAAMAAAHHTASDMTELRAALRLACARKRGPKPQVTKESQERTA